MPSNRREKIKSIFIMASEMKSSNRADFLEIACGEDYELRLEIENLLASFDTADSFLENAAVGEVASVIIEKGEKLSKGQEIGFFEIISLIGEGGMGEVYLAKDKRLNRKAALKILPAEFTRDYMRLKRFRLEAQTASALNHPNILTIYEIGDYEETNYIATEFVEGVTLRDKLNDANLKISEILDIAIQTASGLAVAHKTGIAHRDIKPENIMIRPDRIVKILDFGLAKLTEKDSEKNPHSASKISHLTNPGTLMGTVNYMSPEQAGGDKLDGRTDLWSLGVCLYEILNGKLPFQGKTINHTIVAIMEEKPLEFELNDADISPKIQKVILKLLQKTPANRYQTAKNLIADLRKIKRELQSAEEIQTADFKKPANTTKSENEVKSIAVLPFATYGLSDEENFLGLGLTDALIMHLSRTKNLIVRPLNSVKSFADSEESAAEIGKKLQVKSVLVGNLQKFGEKLRVTVHLFETNTQNSIWSDKFTAEIIDFFDVQDKIAEQVSEKLVLRLDTIERKKFQKPQTDDKAAYLEYIKGRYFLDQKTAASSQKAVEQFKKALELDPTYALAYTGLADAYCSLGIWGEFSGDEIFPMAVASAKRALQIDDKLAEGFAALGHAENAMRNWSEVEYNFKKAIEINPNYAATYGWLARFYTLFGRHKESAETLQAALKLDPLSPHIKTSLAGSYYFAGDFKTAIEKVENVLKIHPQYVAANVLLGLTAIRTGEFEKAIKAGQNAFKFSNEHLMVKAFLGTIYAAAGERKKAFEIVNELEEDKTVRQTLTYSIACVYAELGEKEKAIQWLEKGFDQDDANLHSIATDFEFDSLRGDKRFQKMLRRLNLTKI